MIGLQWSLHVENDLSEYYNELILEYHSFLNISIGKRKKYFFMTILNSILISAYLTSTFYF